MMTPWNAAVASPISLESVFTARNVELGSMNGATTRQRRLKRKRSMFVTIVQRAGLRRNSQKYRLNHVKRIVNLKDRAMAYSEKASSMASETRTCNMMSEELRA